MGVSKTGIVRLLVGLMLVNVLILAPTWWMAGQVGPAWLALEAIFLAGICTLLPTRRWSGAVVTGLAGLIVLGSFLVLADAVARQSLGRLLNLYLDVHLVDSVLALLAGTLGKVGTAVVVVTTVVGVVGTTWLLTLLLRPLRGGDRGRGLVGALLVALPLVGMARGGALGPGSRVAVPAFDVTVQQATHAWRMLREGDVFRAEMDASPASYAASDDLLSGLRGRDVILAFVESYGMSALDDPRYAPVVVPRLADLERRVLERGLTIATGTLIAPSQGGQSWLGHGTILSGLWLENQIRYDLLVASERETLVDDFRRAGYRTAALMPAITLAWPEGKRLGYEQIFAHGDIDYRGPPLNWVTMPDQFTWHFLEQHVLSGSDPRPVFAEVGLISSHAPWTPILPVLEWDEIGDGSIFERFRDAGEAPVELWKDYDRVREHYALSIGYAIDAMAAYVERHGDASTLLIVLGDHQPAPMITGDSATRAVPVHVISGDPTMVAPFLEWGFRVGARPDAGTPPKRMDAFRDDFVRAFSATPPAGATDDARAGGGP